ncbi:hypothetical protein [Nocardia bhagyanarayanae]|uniref:hypothetical protein n=1 Tax=Nocardia bhagyanarayanae TaxID=1215925 RepID=UPI001151CC25|nr:hypothetical protein [Nocardia bhagyanarayanae]
MFGRETAAVTIARHAQLPRVPAAPDLDRADGIIIRLVGADVSRFNRQFCAMSGAADQVRVSPAVDENVLRACGAGANHNLYVPSLDGAVGPHSIE